MHDIGPTMATPSSGLGHHTGHHGLTGANMGPGQQNGGNPYYQQLMAQQQQYAAAYTDVQPMQMAYHNTPASGVPPMVHGGRMPGQPGMQYPGHYEAQSLSPPQFEEDNRPMAPVSPPPQRERFSYTRYQLELLNTVYVQVRYPNSMQKQLIAKRVGITRDQVKIWFQNRRRKDVVKPKSYSEPLDIGPSMVPQNIKEAVVAELMRHEVDMKGKAKKGGKPYQVTVAQRRAAAKQRASTSPINMSTSLSPMTPHSASGSASFGSRSCSSNGSPQSEQNSSRDSHSGVLNISENSNQGFNPRTPTSDCSSESGVLRSEGSPKDSTSDQSQDSSPGYHIRTESISPCSSVGESTTKPSMFSAVRNNAGGVYIPTARGLDMPGPPNAVAPGCSLPLRAMHQLRQKIQQDNEPPKLEIPPNKVAPPSEPIPIARPHGAPLSQPLTVHIPSSMLNNKTSPLSSSNSYSSPPSGIQTWQQQQSSRPDSDEYTQYSRDNLPMTRPVPGQTAEYYLGQPQSLEPKGFSLPFAADSPAMLSSIPAYNESYQSSLKPGSHGAPGPYGRDPYHPLMISSFQNPYYNQDASSHWSRPYSQPF